MPFHVAAYFEDVAALAALTQVNALTDGLLSIRNNSFIMQENAEIPWIWLGGTSLTRARLVSASFRQITNPEIRPYDQAAAPSDDPNVMDLRRRPLRVRAQEELELQTTNDLAMGTENHTAIIAFDFGTPPAPSGQRYTLRGVSTTAAVADAWTEIDVTWDDDLPGGNWLVVGLEVMGVDCRGARLTFENQFWRPGVPGSTDLGNRPWGPAIDGSLGIFGRFTAFRFPSVEVLDGAATAAHEIYLQIMRG